MYTDQNIILENRKKLNISGVCEVLSFDDETVTLKTSVGNLTIKGERLRISNFNTETGDLTAEGRIIAIVYTSEEKSGGFLSKLFR